jgi:hypothetical protein
MGASKERKTRVCLDAGQVETPSTFRYGLDLAKVAAG